MRLNKFGRKARSLRDGRSGSTSNTYLGKPRPRVNSSNPPILAQKPYGSQIDRNVHFGPAPTFQSTLSGLSSTTAAWCADVCRSRHID